MSEMSNLLLERPKAAIASFLNKLLEVETSTDDTWYIQGNELFKLGRLEEAIASYDKALEFRPDDNAVLYNKGVVLLNLGRLEDAIDSYDKALKSKPNDDAAWYNRGVALLDLGRLEEAIDSFDNTLKLKLNKHEAWNNRGVALFNLRRLEEAIASYDKALEFYSEYDIAWYSRGIALEELGCLEEAIASFDNSLKLNSDFDEAWYNRSNAFLKMGRLEEALPSYDNSLKNNPNHYKAWHNRGYVLEKLGRVEEAIANYKKALSIEHSLILTWNNLGIVLLNLGRNEEAIASFDKALEFKPDYADAFYNKACCYALQGNVDQAIENLQQAIKLSPNQYREHAKTDSDFGSIKEDKRFLALIQDGSNEEEGEIRELYRNVSWEEFENILTNLGDNRSSRLAYDQGTLEITMPSQKHEYYKEIIRDLIKYLAEELDLDCESFGSTTWKRKDLLKGAEPDNCFYIQNEPAIRGVKPNIDLSKDPPPDLVLEVDHTSPSLNRLPIYAGLGIPETWIYDMKILRIYQLEAGKYKETDTSLAFGKFPIKEIPGFIQKNITASPRELRKSFRVWVGQYLTEMPQETE